MEDGKIWTLDSLEILVCKSLFQLLIAGEGIKIFQACSFVWKACAKNFSLAAFSGKIKYSCSVAVEKVILCSVAMLVCCVCFFKVLVSFG